MKLLTDKTLKDMLPREFLGGEYHRTPAYAMRDVKVVAEFDPTKVEDPRWPGKHKNVIYYVILENGYAVGWNENIAVGWSFPVQKLHADGLKYLMTYTAPQIEGSESWKK